MIKTSKFRLYSPSVGKTKKKVGATPQKSIMVDRKEDKDLMMHTPRKSHEPTVLPAIRNKNPLSIPVSRIPPAEPVTPPTNYPVSRSTASPAYPSTTSTALGTPVKTTSVAKKSPLSAPQKGVFTVVHKPKQLQSTTPPNGIIGLDTAEDTLGRVGWGTLAGRSDGKAKINQDSFFVDTSIEGWPGISLIAVFDGHGLQGNRVSNFLISNIKGRESLP